MRYALCLLAFLTIAFACQRKAMSSDGTTQVSQTHSVGYNESVDLAIGDGLTLNKNGKGFSFVGVAEDSRCPEGVDCIRAGEAFVLVQMTGVEAPPRRIKVDAGGKPAGRFGMRGGTVQVLDLLPRPREGVKRDSSAYRLRVRVVEAVAY